MKYHEDMVMTMIQEEKRVNETMQNEENQINSLNELLNAIEEYVRLGLMSFTNLALQCLEIMPLFSS